MRLNLLIQLLLLTFFLFLFISCKPKRAEVTPSKYASLYAKKRLIEETYAKNSDSVNIYLKGLYESMGLTQAMLNKFIKKHGSDPEIWVSVQEEIIKELEKLNPSKKRKIKR